MQSAKNQYVLLQLKSAAGDDIIKKLAVITDIAPQPNPSSLTVASNPYLTGMLNEYTLMHQDPYYAGILLYAVCHAHYMVPVQVNAPFNVLQTEDSGKITDITFLSLKTEDGSRAEFPLFTDMTAFEKWQDTFREPLPKTITVRFSHIASLTKENNHGLLINPFGPMSFPMSYDFVQTVTSLPEYQKEFAPKDEAEPPAEDQPEK